MMMNHDDIAYHQARATHELNIGLTSSSVPVARAHLKLSSLHFARARELQGFTAPADRPLFVL